MTTARKYTNQLLEMVDEGIIPARTALLSALCYMSESDVEDMMRVNEMLLPEEAEECRYCGGDCPRDEEHACDGYLGNIDQLYEEEEEEDEEDAEDLLDNFNYVGSRHHY